MLVVSDKLMALFSAVDTVTYSIVVSAALVETSAVHVLQTRPTIFGGINKLNSVIGHVSVSHLPDSLIFNCLLRSIKVEFNVVVQYSARHRHRNKSEQRMRSFSVMNVMAIRMRILLSPTIKALFIHQMLKYLKYLVFYHRELLKILIPIMYVCRLANFLHDDFAMFITNVQ